ncbi:unnamed protein product [Coregonus sp. 'balchen']|nr:unnamed protein product [Coregonus sp. 'balchen']
MGVKGKAAVATVVLLLFLGSMWLLEFMETLGLMVGLISQEIETKTSIIRDLALREATSSRGLVDFQQMTDSGSRTLLRLHRALLWLQGFLEKLAEGPPSSPCLSGVCVMNQEMARMVLNRVVRAIGEVYDRTQRAREEHGMLDLP